MQGLTAAFEYFNGQNITINRVVTHSMGGVALLNLAPHYLENKKIVMISAPAQIFEAMFAKVRQVGISELMLENMLNRVSDKYGISWQNLHPDHSKNKIKIKLFNINEFAKILKKTGWSIISTKHFMFSHIILVKSIYE